MTTAKSPSHIQPFGVSTFLPLTIDSRGLRAGKLVTLSADARVQSDRCIKFVGADGKSLTGLELTAAIFNAQSGEATPIKTFAADQPGEEKLHGRDRVVAAFNAQFTNNPHHL